MKSSVTDHLLEKGYVPDFLIRSYVRRLCRSRLKDDRNVPDDRQAIIDQFVSSMAEAPIALATGSANAQHYEVATEFFQAVLGPYMKYSACYWSMENPGATLVEAEQAMLQLTVERADVQDGMHLLDLGCGWGSLSLFIAEKYPESQITAVSNSTSQKRYIDQKAVQRGLTNLTVETVDMNHFKPEKAFDRILSIEMFEHMRNWSALFTRVANWLNEEGRFFMHIFTYAGIPYLYDANDPEDWMARNFFAGGMMPCPELPRQFSEIIAVEQQWQINGRHYAKTLNAWLEKMDAANATLRPIFRDEFGTEWKKYWHHWRVFFMACAEVFGYADGKRWFVSHYLMKKH